MNTEADDIELLSPEEQEERAQRELRELHNAAKSNPAYQAACEDIAARGIVPRCLVLKADAAAKANEKKLHTQIQYLKENRAALAHELDQSETQRRDMQIEITALRKKLKETQSELYAQRRLLTNVGGQLIDAGRFGSGKSGKDKGSKKKHILNLETKPIPYNDWNFSSDVEEGPESENPFVE